jgi:hypothetical protein
METGFVADLGEFGFTEQKWHPGEPTKSFLTGMKMEKEKVIPVRTLRCPKCGYLESYAVSDGVSNKT